MEVKYAFQDLLYNPSTLHCLIFSNADMVDTRKLDKEQIDKQILDTRQTLKYAEDLVKTYKALQRSEGIGDEPVRSHEEAEAIWSLTLTANLVNTYC